MQGLVHVGYEMLADDIVLVLGDDFIGTKVVCRQLRWSMMLDEENIVTRLENIVGVGRCVFDASVGNGGLGFHRDSANGGDLGVKALDVGVVFVG